MSDTHKKSIVILVVEDDEASRIGLADFIKLSGYKVYEADRLKSAFKILGLNAGDRGDKDKIDIVITDLKLPDGTGLDLLKVIKKDGKAQSTDVVVVTGFSSVKTAVEAIKLGAYDYITKPVNLDELSLIIKRIISNKSLIDELNTLKTRLDERFNFGNLITSSKKMIDIVNTAITVSNTNSTVLIEGESGTGKELLANIIVNNSRRKNKPFIRVNCAALSETILESELFGHEKGAYTGADSLYKGRFEIADGGTIFLDEIGEVSMKTQSKILRVLQEKELERVGGNKTIKVDIRVIAASQDIEKKVSNGEFRRDLYYRLNVINLKLIPLRERKEDIPVLIKRFLEDFSKENDKNIMDINKGTLDILLRYGYPGNVRELKNIIEYMVAVTGGDAIDESLLPNYLKEKYLENEVEETGHDLKSERLFSKDCIKIPVGATLEDAENLIIRTTLKMNNYDKVKTAKDLNVGLKTIYRKLGKTATSG
ncbi:sigma-54-dependent transcriptional regulator [Candidatus Acidulodesulfobacterium sp. H_13]|uniref:sigma-54-dependent transcriptional regulator n=1 Tax=Candidatus Acidulodesulfobacterium sp. H_13 TaxID=3395470 RepID=UPI003AF89154